MKIIEKNWRKDIEMLLSNAVENAVIPDAYSYNGQIEKLQGEISKLRELVARLVEVVINEEGRYSTDPLKVKHILGTNYEVEE